MNFILDILKGMVMGIANVIPGVSGGTMAVSMGIYDKLITALTHLLKDFKKSFWRRKRRRIHLLLSAR